MPDPLNLDFVLPTGKLPKPEAEYLFLHDRAARKEAVPVFSVVPLAYGTVVVDVVQRRNGAYDFKVKATGEEYRTQQGWALAENTLETIDAFARVKAALEEIKRLKAEVNSLYRQHTLLK